VAGPALVHRSSHVRPKPVDCRGHSLCGVHHQLNAAGGHGRIASLGGVRSGGAQDPADVSHRMRIIIIIIIIIIFFFIFIILIS
jgi:hypothetical protein